MSVGMALRSGVLDQDVADDVGEVLAAVAGLLEPVVDLLPLQDLDPVGARPSGRGPAITVK